MEKICTFSEVIAKCRQTGDDLSWRAFVRYLQPLIGGATSRAAAKWGAASRDIVEDLTQDAFLKLCRNDFAILKKVEGMEDRIVLSFIRVIVTNMVHDRFRAERASTRFPEAGFAAPEAFDQLVDKTHTPGSTERRLQLAEIDRVLTAELTGTAAARDKQVFWFYFRYGMTAKAIAAIPAIGLSQKGVESLIFRLVELLKEKLAVSEGIGGGGSFI